MSVSDGRGRRVPDRGLAAWLAALAPARVRGDVAVALVTDAHIRQLNRTYRRHDHVTDVLSFPAGGDGGHLGDIVIATGRAARQARDAGHAYGTELKVLALHGLLHLLGYDHDDPGDRGRMARAEARLRRKGGLRQGLIGRTGAGVGPEAPVSGPRRSRGKANRLRQGSGESRRSAPRFDERAEAEGRRAQRVTGVGVGPHAQEE